MPSPRGAAPRTALLIVPDQRWLNSLVVLGTIAVGCVVIFFASQLFSYFGDIVLVFFLGWLLAFILSPLVNRLDRALPFVPRVVSVVIVYGLLVAIVVWIVILLANALASSILEYLAAAPGLMDRLPETLAPWQRWLDGLGLDQVDLVAQAREVLANLGTYGREAIGPLQQVAVASVGTLGNLLVVLMMSLYMVADGNRILAFLFRLVPRAWRNEAVVLQRSVSQSFGGFLRGQAGMGVAYFGVALVANAAGGLDYAPVTSVASGVLQMIPFFGPYVSWAPPVLVAIVSRPDALPVVLPIMVAGWLLVMNVLQPRLMSKAVGIHPLVVLGSVLIGERVAGITGAIFAVPIAAVLSTMLFHVLGRTEQPGPAA